MGEINLFRSYSKIGRALEVLKNRIFAVEVILSEIRWNQPEVSQGARAGQVIQTCNVAAQKTDNLRSKIENGNFTERDINNFKLDLDYYRIQLPIMIGG